MKFDLVSDLHEDFLRYNLPEPNEGSTVLVVAGDLAEWQNLRGDNFQTLRHAKSMYDRVVYVPGNHEYYGGNYQNVNGFLEEECAKIGVDFMNCGNADIDGTLFVGATLFSDFNGGEFKSMNQCKMQMADYTYISFTEPDGYRHTLMPENVLMLHKYSLEYIKGQAIAHPDKNIVLVTHHAMSPLSIAPKHFTDHHLNGGYVTNLESVFHDHKNIKVHVHGHTHDFFRYTVAGTRVYCNPRGYVRKGQEERYFPYPVEV